MPKIVLFSVFGLALVACGDDDGPTEPENTAPDVADQTFSVKEDVADGTAVGTVKATDAEKDKLAFSITSGNTGNAFAIAECAGTITVAETLDFETTPTYTLKVSVSDGKLSSNANIIVNITDVDEATEPVNTAPAVVDRTFKVKENAMNGTTVGTVQATDAEKDKLTFSINSGNTDNVFEINAASGAITIAGTLDFENTPDYTLAVKVSDGELAGTADITVNVTDVDVPGEYLPQRDIPANIATSPIALWSDGTTIWVVDNNDAKLYAYTLATKARDAAKDIDLDADNANPSGLWSNKTTIWVTDWNDAKLYAYTLATRVRDAAKDIDLDADNDRSVGIWSDGTTLWVVQNESGSSGGDELYAYNLTTGVRDPAKDFDLDSDNILPRGLWSDNTTIWVADVYIRKLYAYTLATGKRDAAKDFDRLADFRAPTGLWSDGTIIWVAKPGRFYAYRLK